MEKPSWVACEKWLTTNHLQRLHEMMLLVGFCHAPLVTMCCQEAEARLLPS